MAEGRQIHITVHAPSGGSKQRPWTHNVVGLEGWCCPVRRVGKAGKTARGSGHTNEGTDRQAAGGWAALLLCEMFNFVVFILPFCNVHFCCCSIQFPFPTCISQSCSVQWAKSLKFSSFNYSIHSQQPHWVISTPFAILNSVINFTTSSDMLTNWQCQWPALILQHHWYAQKMIMPMICCQSSL